MVISDLPHHKVDIEFVNDEWLQITVFHRAESGEWKIKVVGLLSPDVQREIVSRGDAALANAREAGAQ